VPELTTEIAQLPANGSTAPNEENTAAMPDATEATQTSTPPPNGTAPPSDASNKKSGAVTAVVGVGVVLLLLLVLGIGLVGCRRSRASSGSGAAGIAAPTRGDDADNDRHKRPDNGIVASHEAREVGNMQAQTGPSQAVYAVAYEPGTAVVSKNSFYDVGSELYDLGPSGRAHSEAVYATAYETVPPQHIGTDFFAAESSDLSGGDGSAYSDLLNATPYGAVHGSADFEA
jgi:hypothetical protein